MESSLVLGQETKDDSVQDEENDDTEEDVVVALDGGLEDTAKRENTVKHGIELLCTGSEEKMIE